VCSQQRDIFTAFPQRWDFDGENAKPIKQVIPEAPQLQALSVNRDWSRQRCERLCFGCGFPQLVQTAVPAAPQEVWLVRNDFLTKPPNVQEIYDTIFSKDKKLFWIEGRDLRFQGYNYFGTHPELMLKWFDTHI
jgi:hypothetical protein